MTNDKEKQRQYNRNFRARHNIAKTSRRYVRFTADEIQYILLHSDRSNPDNYQRKTTLARYFGCHCSSITYQLRKYTSLHPDTPLS